MNLFIISDIHGMYKEFTDLLSFWNPQDKLVLLGDLIDRGLQSLEVIQKAIELQSLYGEQIVFCLGNHEQMFLNFLENPEAEYYTYFTNGGMQTIRSFLHHTDVNTGPFNYVEQANYIKEHFIEELTFLKNGKSHEIIGNVLLTHAGFNSATSDLADTSQHDLLWIRKHYKKTNQTPYVNVFGHTPTRTIHQSDDVWVSKDKKYIAIDGGCVFNNSILYSGQLNAVLLNQSGELLDTFKVINSPATFN